MTKHERVEFYYNEVKKVSLEGLEAMYSPMFDKHFHEMTDDEIKQQLDFWVENEYPQHKEIFEGRKPLTPLQREKNFNNFVKGRK